MAISYVHPMFLLTLSLFFLPTLQIAYDYDFTDCGLAKSYPVKVKGVELFPDKRGYYRLYVDSYTSREITEAYVHYKVTRGTNIVDERRYLLCRYDLTKCPVASGSDFVVRFGAITDFSSVRVKITMHNYQREEIMCVFFDSSAMVVSA